MPCPAMSITRQLSTTVVPTGPVNDVDVVILNSLPSRWNGSPVVAQPRIASITPYV